MNKKYFEICIQAFFALMIISLGVGVTSGVMVQKTVPELVSESGLIITGSVIDTRCQWDANHLNIQTIATVRINKLLQGNSSPDKTIEVMTLGGTVDGVTQWVEDMPSLSKGTDVGLLLRDSSANLYTITGAYQGVFFLQKSNMNNENNAVSDSTASFIQMIGAAKQGKTLDISAHQFTKGDSVKKNGISPTAAPVITSVTPLTASAGTESIITIRGTGFGSKASRTSNADVGFLYRDDGVSARSLIWASGYPYLDNAYDIISWTDTQIQVKVPTGICWDGYNGGASSGIVTVFLEDGKTYSNDYPFTVTFSYGKQKWAGPANYYINPGSISGAASAIQNAGATWNNQIPGSSFRLTYAGPSTSTTFGQNGQSLIYFGPSSDFVDYPGYIAWASSWSTSPGIINEADIEFNTYYTWTTGTAIDSANSMNIEAIVLHETGHWLFLKDLYGSLPGYPSDISPVKKVMFGYNNDDYGNKNLKTLSAADIAGIQWIYPASRPVADFTIGPPNSGAAPFTVQFTDNSTGIITSYAWDFTNDGTTDSIVKNPIYMYQSPGTYSVKLTVTGPGGSSSKVRNNCITVYAPPVANFTANKTSGFSPLSIQFTDSSTGLLPLTYKWNFGDGTSSSLQNPAHTFTATANTTYNVTLTTSKGTDSSSKSAGITVNVNSTVIPPVANFTTDKTSGFSPLSVQFTDSSTGSLPLSYQWNFGDGTYSQLPNPAHLFTVTANTSYTVTLTASNSAGSASKSSAITVNVNPSVIPPSSITDLHNTTYLPTSITWTWTDPPSTDFEKVMIYLDGAFQSNVTKGVQTYMASSLAPETQHTISTQTVGTTGLINQTLVNHMSSTAPASPTTGSVFVQSNPTGARIYLDYSDTGIFTPATIPNLATGSHVIRCSLSGYDDTTQTVSVAAGQTTDVMIILQKSGNVAPKADFSASTREGGSPLFVQFTDKSINSPTSWLWTFGDGSTSTAQNPSHSYIKAGLYSVKLKVSNPSGTNGLSRSGYITVTGSASTTGSISIQSNPTGAKIYLDDADTGFVTPKTISNVPVGNHVIRCSLVGYTDNSQTVSVSANQVASVNITLVSNPNTGSIFVQSNPSGAKIYFDDADTGFVTPNTISNVPVGSHVIRCSLVGYTDNSQTVSVSLGQTTDVMITLQKSGNIAPKADFSASTREGRSPLPVQFTDKSTNSPTSWLWTFGDGSTSNIQNPSHTYLKSGLYSVKLKVSNSAGTSGLSRSGFIVVS